MVSRFAAYGIASTLLAGGVVANALYTRANFYAAAVGIGKSSGALMVLANCVVFIAISAGIALKSVFFGRLRPTEHEHLYEKLWFFLTESLLALTIFRDDFDAPFVLTYGLLLFLKCFHWITADRVEYIDQIPPPGPPTLFHIRIISITSLLCLADAILVAYSLDSIMDVGVSGMVLFAAEFMILLASILSTFAKYVISVVDLRRARGQEDAPPWEEKSMYIFYVNLATDFAKLATYITFFTVIFLNYGLPLHILRDVYFTLRSFIQRCGDLIRYRRATRDMDALYPDATRADLDRNGDLTCIICREEMVPREPIAVQPPVVDDQPAQQPTPTQPAPASARSGPNETPKKLSCGHVFHFHCLRAWLERQQSCPTCRHPVLRAAPTRANRQPDAPAAAPAPGARPAAPAAAQPQPTPAAAAAAAPQRDGAAANPMADPMRQFQQYFHLPEPATPPTDAARTSQVPAASTSAPSPNGLENENRPSLGIWGAPVVPGRFTAVPDYPPRMLSSSGAVTTRRAKTGKAVIGSSSQAQSTSTSEELRPAVPSKLAPGRADAPMASPTLSGASTPFTSNPPNVFTSTSESRPSDAVSIETPAQRAAAAAQRRLGPSASTSITAASSSAPSTPQLTFQSAPAVSATSATSSVGEAQYFQPYLVPLYPANAVKMPLPSPHPASPNQRTHLASSSFSVVPSPPSIPILPDELSPEDLERLSSETREGLEERIRLLHRLDGMLYNVLGDLTKVRSLWSGDQRESEPAAALHADESSTPKGGSPTLSPRLERTTLQPAVDSSSPSEQPAQRHDNEHET